MTLFLYYTYLANFKGLGSRDYFGWYTRNRDKINSVLGSSLSKDNILIPTAYIKNGLMLKFSTNNSFFDSNWLPSDREVPLNAGISRFTNKSDISQKSRIRHEANRAVEYVHCKKRLAAFPSPVGMSLTKLFLVVKLNYPTQGEFGKTDNFFTVYSTR